MSNTYAIHGPQDTPTQEEFKAAVAELEALGVTPHEFEPSTDEELRDFVNNLIGNAIYTSAHVTNPRDIPMVFMCIALGGMEVPDEVRELAKDLLVDPGPKPEMPPPPPEPDKPTYPVFDQEPPPEPELAEPDPKVIATIDSNIEWEHATEDEKARYLASVDNDNEVRRLEHQEALQEHADAEAAHAKACEEVDRKHEEALEFHRTVTMAQYETDNASQRAKLEEWLKTNRTCNLYEGALRGVFWRNLGVIWEYIDKAGPRSINGHPSFFSHRLLSLSDWHRAHKAYVREMERRQNIEV